MVVDIMLQSFILMICHATIWFLMAVWLKRNDVADIAWGTGFVLLGVYFLLTRQSTVPAVLIYGLAIMWGLRLSIHLYVRNHNKEEDFRYRQWRADWGKMFLLRSYFQVFLLQGFLFLLIASPLIIAASATDSRLSFLSITGILIWIIGFYFQVIADWQLQRFQKNKQPGEIIQTGLWKYSRHPNYFGEVIMWWGIFCIACTLKNGWLAIISPVTITVLIVFVSGIPMLEKKYNGNAMFEAYKKRTSALIPLPPKRT